MTTYFLLQYQFINRRFKDANLPPIIGYLLAALLFVGLSLYLFYKTTFAQPIYIAIALSVISPLADNRRNDFLNLCFGNTKQRIVRVIENLLVTLPFVLFLLYKQYWLSALCLTLLASLVALIRVSTTISITIPTPFYKKPFEFVVGFRQSYLAIFAAYALTVIAICVANFNLGIFAVMLVFVICMGYYTKPENSYFVWIHNLTAKQFLFAKIQTALSYASLLVLPIIIALAIFYPNNIWWLLLFWLVGSGFLVGIVVGKYANYPHELGITQAIMLALCISFPPLLLLLIPYLFFKATKRLSPLLP